MSRQRRNASKATRGRKAVDRPFDPHVLRKAKEIADQYQVILEPDPDMGFLGRGLELPWVMADGLTPNQCVAEVREAMTTAVAYLLEEGQSPPSPSSEATRTEQVNIRLTTQEKVLLEQAARSGGFRGVSDYVRSNALAKLK